MIRSETFHTDNSGFGKAMEFIKEFLADCKIESAVFFEEIRPCDVAGVLNGFK